VIYLLSATKYEVNIFNFTNFPSDLALQVVLDPNFDTGDTELNLCARRVVLSPQYDESCLFQLFDRPGLRLFFDELKIE